MRLTLLLLIALIICTTTTCNFFQVMQVAEKLGYEILTPPAEMLGSRENRGDTDGMWQWLNETAPQADFAVISTDALIYGSLVGSRLQELDPPKIMALAHRFQAFDEKFPPRRAAFLIPDWSPIIMPRTAR